jgi:hypothetical protein
MSMIPRRRKSRRQKTPKHRFIRRYLL